MKYRILLVIPVVVFAACKPSREKLITRKWQLRSTYTETVERTIQQQLHYIDTLGAHDTSSFEKMGIKDLRAYKEQLRAQVAAYQAEQAKVVSHTSYDFKPQGIVYVHSLDGLDSAQWKFKGEDILELNHPKEGRTTNAHLDLLTKDSLKLAFTRDGIETKAVLTPAEN